MTGPVIKLGNPQGKLSEMLGMSLGEGIGNGLNTFFANRSLESVMKDKALENAPLSKKLEATRSALSPYGEKGQQIFEQRMAIEQQAKIGRSIYDSLIRAGYPDETAKIWQNQMENAPVGGQTDVIRKVNELISRSNAGKGMSGEQPNSREDQELNDILSNQDEGLTPSEKVSRQTERFKTGQPIREEAASKLRSFARDKERFGILESLNNSGKLPNDFGLVNVDKEGNLRLPFAASPEAQRFMKTLNEFSSSAKDTYGSRVTNFDLAQFLKRFPTLLNSPEGRKQILQQMKVVNDINSVYYKNLQDIFKKAGGARRIDSDVAADLAERQSEKPINELVKKFDEIGQFSSLPAASEFKGRKIRDKGTGEILISDGENWKPVE